MKRFNLFVMFAGLSLSQVTFAQQGAVVVTCSADATHLAKGNTKHLESTCRSKDAQLARNNCIAKVKEQISALPKSESPAGASRMSSGSGWKITEISCK